MQKQQLFDWTTDPRQALRGCSNSIDRPKALLLPPSNPDPSSRALRASHPPANCLCLAYAAKKYPMTAASIVPGARAEVAISKDKNGNTRLKMRVQHLANLENLTPR